MSLVVSTNGPGYQAHSGELVLADASAGPVQVRLPDSDGNTASLTVQKVDGSAHAVTLVTADKDVAPAQTDLVIEGELVTLLCADQVWRAVGGHRARTALDNVNLDGAAGGQVLAVADDDPGSFGLVDAVLQDGTPVGTPVVVKPLGDGRTGVWEYIHDDMTGYLFHLLMGPESTSGAWIAGIGIDAGAGNGFIFRNKSAGIGLKIEQTATVASATGYGMSVEQKSAVAPAVFMEQKLVSGGAAPLLDLISYETSTSSFFFRYQGQNGKGGVVRSATGICEITADIETNAAGFRARSNNGVAPGFRNHALLDATEGVGAALTWYNNTGSSGSWWPFRIRGNGSNWIFETSASSSTVGTFGTANEILRIKNNQISFFGATPVSKKSGWGPATGTATRTTFDTASVTLPQLAERVKALIDDLHATAGYGLLAA